MRNLTYNMKSKHPYVSVERKVQGTGKKVKTGLDFKCDQCGFLLTERRSLDRHVARNHADNPTLDVISAESRMQGLVTWRCTTGPTVAVAPAAKRRRTAAAPPKFAVQRERMALGGASEMYAVDMQEADHLTALQGAVRSFQPSMSTYHRDHWPYKFQMAVDAIFHKAVDPTVVTQPPVTLTSEMVAVYAGDAPPLEDINRQLLNLVEIYEHNGSGWVFSHFASLQLTLWHLDPLRASAFVPLPRWIRDKKATTHTIGTGDDCFKWAVRAGVHHTTADNPNRMVNYVEHACGYDFSSLCFPVSLSSIAPFAAKNNLSINVYGVEDERKLFIHFALPMLLFDVDMCICCCMNAMEFSITLQ